MFRFPYLYRGRPANRYMVETQCAHCRIEMLQHRSNARRYARAFCSQKCKGAEDRKNSEGQKTLKRREHGEGCHVLVRKPCHPRASKAGLVFEHVLVAEQIEGRPIAKHERVHHINCVKDDNRPENLFVCANDTEHFLVHGSLNACVAQLIAAGVLVFDREDKRYRVRE